MDNQKFLKMQIHLAGGYADTIRKLAEHGDCTPGKVAARLLTNHLDLITKPTQKPTEK